MGGSVTAPLAHSAIGKRIAAQTARQYRDGAMLAKQSTDNSKIITNAARAAVALGPRGTALPECIPGRADNHRHWPVGVAGGEIRTTASAVRIA
jgi:hypothetical protein